MKFRPRILLLLLLLMSPLQADQDGVVVRAATVYSNANSTSPRVGQLAAGARVSVFSRQGGWKEVFSEKDAIIGWVRSYQVREGDFAPGVQTETQSDSRGFLSGLAAFSRKASSFFGGSRGSTSSSTATIGVRGLSEAEIKSAVADFEELARMKTFASDAQRASAFASRGGLAARRIGHIAGPK